MSEDKPLPQPVEEPKMHPPVEAAIDKQDGEYVPAKQDIESTEHLAMVENFIGSVYGEAKQIDNSNIGDSKYTQGLKFDAKEAIVQARKDLISKNNNIPQQTHPGPQQLQPTPQQFVQPPPVPNQPVVQQPQAMQPVSGSSDSLILKHEIDQLKEQIKDIKKLYDEFFKLKQVKGKWEIKANNKIQNAPSVAKAWNVINKLLKSKTESIIIQYKEIDE